MALFQVSDGSQIHFEKFAMPWPHSVFFIHGNLASNNWWYPLQKEMQTQTTTSGSGQMWMAEFRGCGQSSAPRSQAEVNMHQFADDFIELIKSQTSGETIYLVGHSTGGLIAALMMAKEPDLFRGGILLDPVGAQGVQFEASMDDAFAAMKTDQGLTATVIGSTIHNNNAEDAWFKNKIVPDAYRAVQSVGAGVLKALNGLDVRDQLKSIKCPVLVLHGEHDQLLSMDESKKLATYIPGARFEVVPGQGHCTNIESPKLLAEIINKNFFL